MVGTDEVVMEASRREFEEEEGIFFGESRFGSLSSHSNHTI